MLCLTTKPGARRIGPMKKSLSLTLLILHMQKTYPVWCTALALVGVIVTVASPSYAVVLTSSTFDTTSEGWLVKDLPFPSAGAPPTVLGTFVPTFNSAGGNPGGFLSQSDPSANVWYWYAPATFLGNKSTAYGGTLTFDLAVTGNGFGSPPSFNQEDVILVGSGLTLAFDTAPTPGPTSTVSWLSYSVGLTETGWKKNGLGGPAATQAEMQTVLGSLTDIFIRGEFLFGLDDIGRLDNVVLGTPSAVPEPSTLTLFGLGSLGVLGYSLRRWRPKQRAGVPQA
jgi:Laminin B (Domain IV)/PEP-CTERM motif